VGSFVRSCLSRKAEATVGCCEIRQTRGVSQARLDDRRCPYCGCNFTPEQPDQRYCGPLREEQARLEGKHRDAAPPRS
jgi:hypothetical protein